MKIRKPCIKEAWKIQGGNVSDFKYWIGIDTDADFAAANPTYRYITGNIIEARQPVNGSTHGNIILSF